ncbi:rho GTPase-activating protein 24-like isoform X2 [Pecten maximus]|uniref:rho GTPase-activating protein 24-like isoform X2 n=1 Tax=Pecten maximus TaxID=6579 RepID=UPI0014589437|nr:rho GTPase-activating protein 24-like isoform X2 [Pecten maximus]
MNNPVHRQRIRKCGWLRKQGGMVKTWHRRWFCLNGDCLFYFSKEDDLKALGSIFLPGNRVVEHAFNPDDPDKFLLEIFPGSVQSKMTPNHDTFLLWAATAEERDTWIKALRKIMHAPFGGAIFGQSLQDTMAYERRYCRKVPFIITHSVEFLRQYGMETEGIFRLAGRTSLIKDYKEKFDCAEKVKFDISEIDIHSVASLVKMYLRELPDSIIPSQSYQKFMNIALNFQDARDLDTKMEVVVEANLAISEIPDENYNSLSYLCTFFHDVGEKSAINKMTNLNLGTVLGPNIVRNVTEVNTPELLMATADLTQQLAYMMICYPDRIFTKETESPPQVPVDTLLDLSPEEEPKDIGNILQPVTDENIFNQPLIRTSLLEELKDIQFADNDVFTSPQNDLSPVSDLSDKTSSSTDNMCDDNVDSDRPIVPKRKSKLERGRRVSERAKNDPCPPSPTSPTLYKPDRSSLIKRNRNSLEINGSENVIRNHESQWNRRTVLGTHEDDKLSKLRQEALDLNRTIEALKKKHGDQMSATKLKYENHIKSLSTQLETMKEKYEKRVASLEKSKKEEVKNLCIKLESERHSRNEAVSRVMELQAELQKYQSQFGKLDAK